MGWTGTEFLFSCRSRHASHGWILGNGPDRESPLLFSHYFTSQQSIAIHAPPAPSPNSVHAPDWFLSLASSHPMGGRPSHCSAAARVFLPHLVSLCAFRISPTSRETWHSGHVSGMVYSKPEGRRQFLPQRVWKRAWVWPQLRIKMKPVHILGGVCGGDGDVGVVERLGV